MRILIVHQYYLFSGQPGGSRFNELASRWAAAGHDVTVVAGNRNYLTGEIPKGFDRGWTIRTMDGPVVVWRCRVARAYNRGYVGRMWAFLGFTLASLWAGLKSPRPDVVITTSPPLTVAITGWLLTRLRLRRIPWVFEIRDLWPESAVTTGVLSARSPITRALYWLEALACRSADRINVLSPAFRDDVVTRGLAVVSKVVLVQNGADIEMFKPGPRHNDVRERLGWGDRTVFLYAGAHGRANAVQQLVEAAERLRHRSDILIITAGDGPERAAREESARNAGLRNIVFLGPIAKERMPELVNAADVGVAVLQDNPTFKTVYPNKVFDYMACARPVLMTIDGAARRLVCDEAGAGAFAPPENPDALAREIEQLADRPQERASMGERGRRWVVEHASREALADRYLRILEGLGAQTPTVYPAKRLLDIAASAAGLVLLSPLLLACALVVLIQFGRPVLFRQQRPGLDDALFTIYKFRTMRSADGFDGRPLPDGERLTALGRFLRAFSLDELPELWNVLKGDMSLVGPRPLLPDYVARYTPHQARRHDVKPGITGWAQVNGRNSLTWEEKFDLDVFYVDHASLAFDLRILLMTVWKAALRQDINEQGQATAREFMGTPR